MLKMVDITLFYDWEDSEDNEPANVGPVPAALSSLVCFFAQLKWFDTTANEYGDAIPQWVPFKCKQLAQDVEDAFKL